MKDERVTERDRAQAACKREAQTAFGWGVVACVVAVLALLLSLALVEVRARDALDAGAPDLWHALYLSDAQVRRVRDGDEGQMTHPGVTMALFSAPEAQGMAAVTVLSELVTTLLGVCCVCIIATRAASELSDTGKPFSVGMVRTLRRAGRLFIGMGLLPIALGFLVVWAAPADATLTVGGGNGYLVLAGSCGLLCARVFEYGVILQRQDDELL